MKSIQERIKAAQDEINKYPDWIRETSKFQGGPSSLTTNDPKDFREEPSEGSTFMVHSE